jgi:hypothetical protein
MPGGGTAVVRLSLDGVNCLFSDLSVRTQADFYAYDDYRGGGPVETPLFILLIFYGFALISAAFMVRRLYNVFVKKKGTSDGSSVIETEIDANAHYGPGVEHHENIGGPLVISMCRHCGMQIPPNARFCNKCGKEQ